MGFLDLFLGRSNSLSANEADAGAPNAMDTKAHAARPYAGESVMQGPIYSRIGPGAAKTTPHRYEALAQEGYRQNVIAFRAINVVARGLASIPLRLNKKGVMLDMHPLLSLLARPNPRTKGANFLANMVGYYLIAGNAYTLAVGPDGRPPKELWLLRPNTVKVLEGKDGLAKGYEQQITGPNKGHKQRFAANDVLHWKTFNPLSDWYGMAPLDAAATAIDAHNEGSRWNLALIQNGGTPSGVLYQEDGDKSLTDAQFRALKEQVEEHYVGALNAGRPLLLEGGLKWQDLGMSPKDMDWTSAKNMSAREIALAFGVPPQMLGIPDAQTYSNYQEARQSLWEETIIPMAKDILCELNGWLTPQFGDGLMLTLDLDDIPSLAVKRNAQFERIGNAAFLTTNEKRKALGFSEIKGGDSL